MTKTVIKSISRKWDEADKHIKLWNLIITTDMAAIFMISIILFQTRINMIIIFDLYSQLAAWF